MPFRVATFNAGLAVGVLPYTTERLSRVVGALAELDVDLLFVQEFWLDAHWAELVGALASRLPNAFRPAPAQPPRRAACTAHQLAPLVDCAERHCAGLRDEALARCVVSHCASTAFSLPMECLNCVASNPVGTLHEIIRPCLGDPTLPRAISDQGSTGLSGLIAYGGSFGTGLLARVPLDARDVLVLEATVNARGALYARTSVAPLGKVEIFAAHLSPGGAEQGPQVDRLIGWIEEKADPAVPALLLGDLNTTPGSALFRRFQQAGFREADPRDRRGTYLHDGLGTGRVSASSWRLDHVLVRGIEGARSSSSELVLYDAVTIDVGGSQIQTTLSDHCGVLGTIG
jgi:endonuclease/exonuclease/phosphatase family metal-dependent hydrolase